jgi:hypothetical protein
MGRSERRRIRIGLVLAACILATSQAAVAQPSTELDPAVLATLRRMADQLRSLPSLRVEARVEYDALQRDGQTIEFGSTREIAVRRPDRIRAEATERSGAQRSLYFDGKRVTVFDRSQGVYASADMTGELDAVLRFAAEELRMPVPLGELLSTELGRQLDEGLTFAALVAEETIEGVRCDHLALRNADRDVQLWVQQGKTPLPRRIAITWSQAPGRPQFRAQLTKWELSPKLPDSLFAFDPPQGAERVRFHQPATDAPSTGGGR